MCQSLPASKLPSSGSVPIAHLNNEKKQKKGGVAIGHAPIQIPPISTVFKLTSPLLATSHGSGALVDMVVMGAEVPGSNPRASPPTTYAYSLTYGWCVLYGMFNIWLGFI
jgi:hypothetical protein